MTFDNQEELYKIARIFSDARLVLRIKVDDSKSIFKLNRKFGASVPDALNLLEIAKKLNLNVVGISFHVGSNCESVDPYVNAIKDAKLVFAYGQSLNFDMQILDIGGGFPGAVDAKVTFEEIAEAISQTIDQLFPPSLVDGLRIIAEPGTYYVESSSTLVTQVISRRELHLKPDEIAINKQRVLEKGLFCPAKRLRSKPSTWANNAVELEKNSCVDYQRELMYYLNDGLFGSFLCIQFGNWFKLPEPFYTSLINDAAVPADEITRQDQTYVQSVLWGPTCDQTDLICDSVLMPELNVGDFIIFRKIGAYTNALATRFNGFPLASFRHQMSESTLSTLKTSPHWPELEQILCEEESTQNV